MPGLRRVSRGTDKVTDRVPATQYTDRGSKLLSCLVEHDGIEPSTSAMPLRRSPS